MRLCRQIVLLCRQATGSTSLLKIGVLMNVYIRSTQTFSEDLPEINMQFGVSRRCRARFRSPAAKVSLFSIEKLSGI
jgi:hypothetical protein